MEQLDLIGYLIVCVSACRWSDHPFPLNVQLRVVHIYCWNSFKSGQKSVYTSNSLIQFLNPVVKSSSNPVLNPVQHQIILFIEWSSDWPTSNDIIFEHSRSIECPFIPNPLTHLSDPRNWITCSKSQSIIQDPNGHHLHQHHLTDPLGIVIGFLWSSDDLGRSGSSVAIHWINPIFEETPTIILNGHPSLDSGTILNNVLAIWSWTCLPDRHDIR